MQRCRRARALLAAGALLFCLGAEADPATEGLAPGQLAMAEMQLEQAMHAFSEADYHAARRLSFQAQLDARLAWKMTELAELRRKAASVVREAESLRIRSVMADAR